MLWYHALTCEKRWIFKIEKRRTIILKIRRQLETFEHNDEIDLENWTLKGHNENRSEKRKQRASSVSSLCKCSRKKHVKTLYDTHNYKKRVNFQSPLSSTSCNDAVVICEQTLLNFEARAFVVMKSVDVWSSFMAWKWASSSDIILYIHIVSLNLMFVLPDLCMARG